MADRPNFSQLPWEVNMARSLQLRWKGISIYGVLTVCNVAPDLSLTGQPVTVVFKDLFYRCESEAWRE